MDKIVKLINSILQVAFVLVVIGYTIGRVDITGNQGDIMIIEDKTYEIENRYTQGYWFISVDTNEIDMSSRNVYKAK